MFGTGPEDRTLLHGFGGRADQPDRPIKFGVESRDRTGDAQLFRLALYQLSYLDIVPTLVAFRSGVWRNSLALAGTSRVSWNIKFGGEEGLRTLNLSLAKRLLYQLSYNPTLNFLVGGAGFEPANP